MLPLLRHRLTLRVAFTLLFELLALNTCFAGLLHYRKSIWSQEAGSPLIPLFALTCTAVIQFGFWSYGLYSRQVIYSGRRVVQNLAGSFVLLSLLLFPVCYLFTLTGDPLLRITFKFYIVLLALFVMVVGVERFLVLKLFNRGSYLGNILILGTADGTAELIGEARRHHGRSLHLVGIAAEREEQVGRELAGVRILGTLSQIRDIVRNHRVSTVLLSLPYGHPDLPLDFLLECKMNGLFVSDASAFYEGVGQKILLEKLDPFSVLFPGGYTMSKIRWLAKEAFEKLLAFVLLALLALPFLLVMILIRLTSKGPAIYKQERVGKGNRSFTLHKFRTMVDGAERKTGATWASEQDPRVTWIGRLLRRTRFDELPQLFNILKGDMAFVGPRPERPEFVEELKRKLPYYHHRHFVKPGLTGWAQVSFPYAASIEDSREKLRYDLYYVKNMSLFFDLMIVLATLRAVVRGSGVR
jgi:sugar transferase (PEP-CTERM system associated)